MECIEYSFDNQKSWTRISDFPKNKTFKYFCNVELPADSVQKNWAEIHVRYQDKEGKLSKVYKGVYSPASYDTLRAVSSSSNEYQEPGIVFASLSTVALMDEFVKGSTAARVKYANKTIEVSGEVHKKRLFAQGGGSVMLKTNQDEYFVICYFDSSDGLENIKEGNEVKFRGKYYEPSMSYSEKYVYMKPCAIID